MKNYFNEKVTTLNIQAGVPLGVANETWEFSDFFEAARKEGETFEDAVARCEVEYELWIKITDSPSAPTVVYYLERRNEPGPAETTDSPEEAIQDLISWFERGQVIAVHDYSLDENDCYQPAFSQFKTMI